jgi:hypothetical protein
MSDKFIEIDNMSKNEWITKTEFLKCLDDE